jgi:ATP-binding cassette subfamily B protein
MTVQAPGRPSLGAELQQQMKTAAGRRDRRRDLKPLRRLGPFIAAHWKDALAALVFLLLSTAASLYLTQAARMVIDHGFGRAGAAQALNRSFVIGAADVVVLAIASASRFYFVTRLGERVVADLRKALYGHIVELDQAFFLNTRTGEVLSRLTTDITIIENLVGTTMSLSLRNFLLMIGAVAAMLVVSPKLTLFVLVLVPVILGPMFFMGRRVRRLSSHAQDRFADAIAYAGETLDALDTVQAFGRQTSAAARFGGYVETAFRASRRRIGARAVMTGTVILVVFGGIVAVLWNGAHEVLAFNATHGAKGMSGGVFLQFLLLAVFAASSVGVLGEVWGEVQKGSGAMDRIGEILDAVPSIAPPKKPEPLPKPPRGEIEFDHVGFHYPGREDLPALSGFTLKVRPGERVALVGPSGAGKSTVLRLLLRFYDPQAGAVRVDGVDLRRTDPADARARMALVAQDAGLFSGSAGDNIRFGREGASEAEVRAAAEAAQAEGFIEALPEGFDTPVGERAKTLSGGQRQRLALARALVRDAPILLLDEATSALDAENERLVQMALDEAMKGRTTLVIAHRLATVQRADRIVVMDAGRVVEEGRHAELVARGGLYARLAQLQFGGDQAA